MAKKINIKNNFRSGKSEGKEYLDSSRYSPKPVLMPPTIIYAIQKKIERNNITYFNAPGNRVNIKTLSARICF